MPETFVILLRIAPKIRADLGIGEKPIGGIRYIIIRNIKTFYKIFLLY